MFNQDKKKGKKVDHHAAALKAWETMRKKGIHPKHNAKKNTKKNQKK